MNPEEPESQFVVVDDSGAVVVGGWTKKLPTVGDIVWLRGIKRGKGLHVMELELLAPYQLSRPFPSPGSEYYRLNQRPVPRIDRLRQRASCIALIRQYFDKHGFLEVQTPLRVPSPGLEPHLVAEPSGDRFLITSPEYHMKRLLAGGLERFFFLGPSWRCDEVSPHHLHEFCILEWYEAFCSFEHLIKRTEELVTFVARRTNGLQITYRGREISLKPPFQRLSMIDAFREHAGLEIEGLSDKEMIACAQKAGFGPFTIDDTYESVFSKIFVERIEPALIGPQPIILYDYPSKLAALARLKEGNSNLAERFELFAGGLELANGFGELGDPDEQYRRLEADQRERWQAGKTVYPIDQKFISALKEGIPPAVGIALGVDRLVMLLCGAEKIYDVVAFSPGEV